MAYAEGDMLIHHQLPGALTTIFSDKPALWEVRSLNILNCPAPRKGQADVPEHAHPPSNHP